MSTELEALIAQFKKERGYRDNGAAAKVTYVRIKAVASSAELIALLEELLGY